MLASMSRARVEYFANEVTVAIKKHAELIAKAKSKSSVNHEKLKSLARAYEMTLLMWYNALASHLALDRQRSGKEFEDYIPPFMPKPKYPSTVIEVEQLEWDWCRIVEVNWTVIFEPVIDFWELYTCCPKGVNSSFLAPT